MFLGVEPKWRTALLEASWLNGLSNTETFSTEHKLV